MALEEMILPSVITNPSAPENQETNITAIRSAPAPLPDDGTRQLLSSGFWTLAVGLVAALLTKFVFGGVGRLGPHTNSGWLSLIVAMMCLPFGSMLTLLGGAKWLRNRRLRGAGKI